MISPKTLQVVLAARSINAGCLMRGAGEEMLASTVLAVEMVSAFATKVMVETAL